MYSRALSRSSALAARRSSAETPWLHELSGSSTRMESSSEEESSSVKEGSLLGDVGVLSLEAGPPLAGCAWTSARSPTSPPAITPKHMQILTIFTFFIPLDEVSYVAESDFDQSTLSVL